MSRISLLPQAVVDKIAAGEVVVRPVNAVKELVENSLDAGATEISVSIRRGGLDLIKVQDNGSGVDPEDMPIVCARFATSKLREFDDLSRMSTFGFRGEALASISYVAKVSIISRRAADICAHKANYEDGKMVGALGKSAGLKGTIISAESLFHSCAARRRALKYPQEEATRIADLLVKYAIENPHVAFALRRLDAPSSDFRTGGAGDQKATIRALLGARIKELMDVEYSDSNDLHFSFRACFAAPIASRTSTAIKARQERYKSFHLFINGRCVDSPRLKQSIDLVFASKDSTCQFITISLKIDPNRVDVNVHPTKAIVHFLNEEKIIQAIEEQMFKIVNEYCTNGMVELAAALKPSSSFGSSQSLSTTAKSCRDDGGDDNDWLSIHSTSKALQDSSATKVGAVKRPRFSDFEAPSKSRTPKGASNNDSRASRADGANGGSAANFASPSSAQRIRVDANNRTLDEFVSCTSAKDSPAATGGVGGNKNATILSDTQLISLATSAPIAPKDIDALCADDDGGGGGLSELMQQNNGALSRTFQLDSLDGLRRAVCQAADAELTALFRKHHFVGLYSNGFGVFQVDSAAYIVHLEAIVREFFYQFVIFSFGNMGCYRLQVGQIEADNADCQTVPNNNEQLRIADLLELYYEANGLEADPTRVGAAVNTIVALSGLLWDYFSVGVEVSPATPPANERPSNTTTTEGEHSDNELNSLPRNTDVGDERMDDEANGENVDDDVGCDAVLTSIPCIINGFVPPLESLPELVFDLGNVDCGEEENCLRDIATALSKFFTPILSDFVSAEGAEQAGVAEDLEVVKASLCRFVFPSLKSKFLPPRRLRNAVHKITSIEQAFKKFGRC